MLFPITLGLFLTAAAQEPRTPQQLDLGTLAYDPAVVSEGDSPAVQSVGLGNVNGVTLGYQSGVDQGNAEASKDGQTYKITGTATGVDMANPLEPVNKPFEIEVTCP